MALPRILPMAAPNNKIDASSISADPATDIKGDVDSSILATLTPLNAAARACFHQTAVRVLDQQQPSHHGRFMHIDTEQRSDSEVMRVLERDRTSRHSSSGTGSDSPPPMRLPIWSGYFLLDLAHVAGPTMESRAWVAGVGRDAAALNVQFLLCPLAYAKEHHRICRGMRGHHIRFVIAPETGYVRLQRCSRARFEVDGREYDVRDVIERYAVIGVGDCRYALEYSDLTPTMTAFREQLRQTLSKSQPVPSTWEMTPTPSRLQRNVGEWTYCIAVGMGASGRVYGAVSTGTGQHGTAKVAVVKVVDASYGKRTSALDAVKNLQAIEALAAADDCTRIVRLLEVLPEDWRSLPATKPNEIYFIMTPQCTCTLWHVLKKKSSYLHDEKRRLFHSALLGLQWLHSKGWVHRDLKPDNIGVVDDCHAVLLDLDTAYYLGTDPTATIAPTPHKIGTRGYLAPELELTDYDAAVDVWSMGIVGFELEHGRHPWSATRVCNPLYSDDINTKTLFAKQHRESKAQLNASTTPFDNLLASMLSLGIRMTNHDTGERVTVDQALAHAAWIPFDGRGTHATKRVRLK
jgi:hypothetical protein